MTNNPRRALPAVAVQFAVNGLVYANVIPRLPEIRDRVGISTGALGVVLMLGSAAGVLGSLLAGRVVARWGTRQVMVGASLLSIAGLPLIGLATHPAVLVVGLVMVLFFDVFADVAMNVQGSVLSATRATPVMNRLHGLWSLATVVGGGVVALLAAAGVGVAVHLLLGALVLGVVEVLLWPRLLAVDEPHTAPLTSGTPTEGAGRRIAAHRHLAIVLGLGGAAAMAMESTGSDWAALRLTDDLGAGPGLAAAAFVAFTAGMTVGRLGGDWVQVRLGVDRLLFVASVIAAVGLAVASFAGVVVVVLGGLVVAGLGVSVQFPQLYDAAARVPGPPGAGFTALLIGQRLATVLTPLAIGALATTEALGVGEAMAIVGIPAALISIVLSRRPGR